MILGNDAPVLVVERSDAAFLFRAIEALERELQLVAPAQLRQARTIKADLARYLTVCADARCATATDPVQGGRRVAHDAQVNTPPAHLTVTEAASRLGCSASYVRRMAPSWGAAQVAGRWVIPARTIEQLNKERH